MLTYEHQSCDNYRQIPFIFLLTQYSVNKDLGQFFTKLILPQIVAASTHGSLFQLLLIMYSTYNDTNTSRKSYGIKSIALVIIIICWHYKSLMKYYKSLIYLSFFMSNGRHTEWWHTRRDRCGGEAGEFGLKVFRHLGLLQLVSRGRRGRGREGEGAGGEREVVGRQWRRGGGNLTNSPLK